MRYIFEEKKKKNNEHFFSSYFIARITSSRVDKVLCHERCLKHLPSVEAYLREKHLRLCADRVRLEEWPTIIGSIARNRDLVEILIYSRSRRRKVREKINNEERLETLW